jgi:hypothetical protein
LEKQYGRDGYSGMQNTGKNDSIISYFNWRAGIALDVTGMTKSQVEAIPEFYESYFDKALPGELEGFRWYTSGIEGNAGQGFTKWPQAPDGWSIVAGGAWTWSMMGSIRTRNLLCEVHAEVMDFDHIENSPMWKKNSVLDLNAPAKVQRVMFVTLRVRGEGLRNTKDVKWPPKPDKYAPMTLGYE